MRYNFLLEAAQSDVSLTFIQPDVMKANLLSVTLFSLGLSSLMLCTGCDEQSSQAAEAPAVQAPSVPGDAKPATVTAPADPKATNLPPVAVNGTNIVPQLLAPADLKLSPALAEVVKLVQAGVGESVLMAYITNSAEVFNIGSSEILYLHDLGASDTIITTLIQRDSSPQIMARKQAVTAVKPLPPGVALNEPATNVFPGVPTTAPAADSAAAPSTEAPAPPAPAVVYTVPQVIEQPANVSYFYDELSPYGSWVEVSGYGRCWRPTVAVWNSSWRPYADGGRWLWTTSGWYWYSDYSWGWAPFHYGRWTCPAGIGWVWTPDVHWGPAWVSWRSTSSYCGWAPLPPSARFVVGHGFYHNTLSVGFGFDFGLSDHDYVFLPTGRLCDRRPSHYYVAHHHATSLFRDSTVVNHYASGQHNLVVNHGVGFDRVARETRGGIRQVSLRSSRDASASNLRREQIDDTGTTLTIAQPRSTAPAITPPSRPTSALSGIRPRGERTTPRTTGDETGGTTVGNGASSTRLASRDTATTPNMYFVPPVGGNGRARGTQVTRSTTSPGVEPVTPSVTPATTGNATVPKAEAPRVTRSATYLGPRPDSITRPTPVTVVRPPTAPAPVMVSGGAPTPRSSAPVSRVETGPRNNSRSETSIARNSISSGSVSPASPRASTSVENRSAPAPSQSRVSSPSPSYQAPVRSSSPSPAPSVPRVESTRSSSPPSPAPARSSSSDNGSSSRSSRSSGDDSPRRSGR